MGKKKGKRSDKEVAKLTFITALLALITAIISLLDRIAMWLAKP